MLIFLIISSGFPEFFNSSLINLFSFSNNFYQFYLDLIAIGFEAAICIDNCFPNRSILSSDFLLFLKITITAKF